jgi:hypothetical protein
MITTHTFYKNSNTGELIMKQQFTDTTIDFPIHFYTVNRKPINTPNLIGFVEISEKKFNREAKKQDKPIK